MAVTTIPQTPPIADAFQLDALDRELAGTPFAGRVRYFASIDSTNTLAMREAEEGQESGTVYLADEQTGGRGRGAHSWHSAPGSGLYVSILLRPRLAPADILWVSLAAGLAVQQAIREVTSLAVDLRWPNDLLLSGRKLGGILTELNAEVTRVRHAVIGVGLNVHQPAFSPELASLATSLTIETGQEWSRQDLLVAALRNVDREISRLTTENLDLVTADIRERLTAGSSWIKGKQVVVTESDTFAGITDGLDSRGFLRVRTGDGVRTVLSGGVREGGR
jgi:BirA family transcriptional regulator, biotin operon repressor / biotin---[acetyl-CoA-carboxylase] ligase